MRRVSVARVAFAVATGLLAVGAVTTPAAAAEDATFTGTVTDQSGQPVEQALVVLTNTVTGAVATGHTEADGVYTTSVEPGTYRLALSWYSLFQYVPQKRAAEEAGTFTADVGETVRVDEQLVPTGSISGRLTRPDGSPVTGVSIAVHDDVEGRSVSTDDSGVYLFRGLRVGDYQMQVDTWNVGQWVPGATDRAGAATITVRAGQHITLDEVLLPQATLRGRLTDAQGRPRAGHRVLVVGQGGNWQSYDTLTDENGEWSITDVVAGPYRVDFTNPDRTDTQQAETVFTARPGETTTVDYTWLPETTLVVKAVDAATGVPVDGFCVQVPYHVWDPVCSDPDGAATIPGLPPTSLTIDVATPAGSLHFGRRGVPATLAKNRITTVTVPLAQGGKVAVAATDRRTGDPVPETCFRLKMIGRPDTFGSGCTDHLGAATTPSAVLPGTYEAFIEAPGAYGHQWLGRSGGTGDQRAAARIVVRPGRTTTAPAVLLDEAGTISGVLTGVDGAPVSWPSSVGFRADDRQNSVAGELAVPDADGRYSIGHLGPYAWPLLFKSYGYPDQWSGNGGNRFTAVKIPVTPGGDTAYDMTMTRTSTLRGTITPPTASGRLTAHNAATGDEAGFVIPSSEAAAYELPLAGGQQVKLHLTADGDAPTQTWHANAPDITTATKVNIPASGTKRLNLAHP